MVNVDFGMAGLELARASWPRRRRRSTSLAPLAREMAKATTGSSSSRAKVRGSAAPSVDRAELVEAHLAPARQRDRRCREVRDRCGAGERADRLLLARDLAAPAGEIDVVGPQLLVDRRRGDAERQQPVGIERDADLAVDAADARHCADALHALQRARHGVVDEPGQLLGRHARRRGRVGDDRQAFDVDAVDDRLVDGARQVGADVRDRVLDVVERAVDVDRAD